MIKSKNEITSSLHLSRNNLSYISLTYNWVLMFIQDNYALEPGCKFILKYQG